MNNSIPKTATSLANALPSRGKLELYAPYSGYYDAFDWPCYKYNVSSINTHYYIVGNPEYRIDAETNAKELTSMSSGFKRDEFPNLKYDNMLVDY